MHDYIMKEKQVTKQCWLLAPLTDFVVLEEEPTVSVLNILMSMKEKQVRKQCWLLAPCCHFLRCKLLSCMM